MGRERAIVQNDRDMELPLYISAAMARTEASIKEGRQVLSFSFLLLLLLLPNDLILGGIAT
jgi:hypothetical protein